MNLIPRDLDKLQLSAVGELAQKRLARGTRLNVPESIGLIAKVILELIRDGKSVSELMDLGRQILGRKQVLLGIPSILAEVQVEGTFPDGSKLVTIHDPIEMEDGNMTLALYGSFLPIPDSAVFDDSTRAFFDKPIIPGEIICQPGRIYCNQGRKRSLLSVTNSGDRPIQVGSHFHFIESNPMLKFDRQLAYGKRLDILSGTAVRFEPGETKTVTIVEIGGNKIIRGGNGLADGKVSPENLIKTMQRVKALNFLHEKQESPENTSTEDETQSSKRQKTDSTRESRSSKEFSGSDIEELSVTREHYASIYGPTAGDKIRLGDTNLVIEVEKDYTIYGDECKFGGGKVLREGMGQHAGSDSTEALDTIITNALIVDYNYIIKADVGIKSGFIVGIGKGGNPDVLDGVDPNMIVGVNTEVIAGEGLILTAGGIDTHVHYICPQIMETAICSGLTTLLGGGTGPATGSCATTCTPHPEHIEMMMKATDSFPMNFGFSGKGNTSKPQGLKDVINAGVVALKLHEDWGTTPSSIDCCLTIAEEENIQVTIHTDTLNESSFVEHTIAAFKGRTIHTYHSEGAGGGHAPDIITVCGLESVLPSSTNPTRPFTINTLEEHMDMLMVCHHLDSNIPEDVAFAESRIRGETIAAEDILQDMGAISMISSDSQAMGRIGEVICRTWQTANKMKEQRGFLPEDVENGNENDNFRVKRYIAKYTINPAICHGMSHLIGSVEVGKLADLCLWKPSYFGATPQMIIKGGMIAYSQMGDPNASIPTPEPVLMRPMYAAHGKAVNEKTSVLFVSKAAKDSGTVEKYGLSKRIEAIGDVRSVTKKDMKLNDCMPDIKVDPETYVVTADNINLQCPPTPYVPLAQKYYLF